MKKTTYLKFCLLCAVLSLFFTTTPLQAQNLAITVTPSALIYGYVLIEATSVAETVTITNTGIITTTITPRITGVSAAMFAVAPGARNGCSVPSFTLAPSETCTLAVTLTPDTLGAQYALLEIFADDPANSTVQVALSGAGVYEVIPSATEGTLGTEITYTGAPSGFGDKKGKVLIGGIAQKIDTWTNTSIKVIVKKAPLPGEMAYNVSIKQSKPKGALTIVLPGGFTVRGPAIDEVTSDSSGAPGANAIIKGKWFGTKKGKVYLEDSVSGKKKKCKVTEWSMYDTVNGDSRIRFIVPKLPKVFLPGPYTLKVSNKVGSDSTVFMVEEEILLKDDFPGFSEVTDWDDHWTTGVGKIIYDSSTPGFVRLLLDGPGIGGIYHNAEKEHYGETVGGFLYCDLDIRCRNSNNNGWDAPGAPYSPDPTYGFGSRGWGFWNKQQSLSGANIIWFTSISPESESQVRGTRVWIICDGTVVLMQDLNIDLTQWHTYRIQWRPDYIGIFIDNMGSPIAEVIGRNKIPNSKLTFTVWVDNYGLLGTLANPVRTYLSVPDIDQYIDVDYIKIYIP